MAPGDTRQLKQVVQERRVRAGGEHSGRSGEEHKGDGGGQCRERGVEGEAQGAGIVAPTSKSGW